MSDIADKLAWAEYKRAKMLTRSERDAIEQLAWGMEHFGSLTTGRVVKRSTVLRLVALEIAESVGRVAMCDDDGSVIQPERYREGFKLTTFGVEVHKLIIDRYRKGWY